MRSQAANLLSASRFFLAFAWLFAFEAGHRGPMVLGSIADIVFILTALTREAWAGAIPFYIPMLIALSFSQYAIDSMLLSGAPIKSRLGHFGGIINYALVIILGLAPPPALPGIALRALCPLLALFYFAAIGERVAGYLRRNTSRAPMG